MRTAVVGTGISGLGAAWLLAPKHDVCVFEREPRIGGHTHTRRVPDGGLWSVGLADASAVQRGGLGEGVAVAPKVEGRVQVSKNPSP